ncbi:MULTISPECIES: hypothetical protein [Natrinema]|uniref:Uncharacterized protein n=1 Tax=Natrinema gari JCM 14663 TaxID=1230459 RepID=L9ZC65_9EURY|nr:MULTISPECIES: hypothetical protein [Natrinema]AFO56296.1 hypothetical protein NJ7G_1049 [Natrinema sp. J7-2]ELY83217.1 hypothetical protein C486_02593 [Natrinema gari JCM 14663]
MSNLPTRRGFLALTGAGATASLAGCSQLESIGQSDDDAATAVTLQVRPDEEKVSTLGDEIQADIESGDLGRQEAQLAYQKRQRELVESAATDFEDSAPAAITIENSETAYGLFLVTGSDEAILQSLRDGATGAIYPGEQYEPLVQQQQRRAQQLEQQQALLEQQQQAAADGETNESETATETATGTESGDGNDSAAGNETND